MGAFCELFLHSNFLYEKVICLISVMFSVSGGEMKEAKQTHVVQLFIFTEFKAYKLLILPAVIIM